MVENTASISIEPSTYFGIPYKWGGKNAVEGFDCFGMMNWLQQIYRGGRVKCLDWVYEQYPCEKSLPPGFMMSEIQKLLPTTNKPLKPLDVGVFNFRGRYGLGTYILYKGTGYWVYQTDYGSRVTESGRLLNRMHGRYDVTPILEGI